MRKAFASTSILLLFLALLLPLPAAAAGSGALPLADLGIGGVVAALMIGLPLIGMAVGTANDWEIRNEFFDLGQTETKMQNTDVFNDASAGTIRLEAVARMGDEANFDFFQELSSLDSHRDTSSTEDVAGQKMPMGEYNTVKTNRKQGPVEQTIDSLKKKAKDPDEMSQVLGEQSGKAQLVKYVNLGLTSLGAVIKSISIDGKSAVHDATDGKLTYEAFTYGFEKQGDAFGDFACIVMHPTKFFDLFRDSLNNYVIDRIAGAVLIEGTPATMGLPIVVVGSPSLKVTDGVEVGTDLYRTKLLKPGALTIEESEEQTLHSDVIGGVENIFLRWQLEYAFNIGVAGALFDTATGGTNPNESALGTTANWVFNMTDVRHAPGVIIESQ